MKIACGQYPNPSDMRERYNFQLTYNGEGCFPFTWTDYRGGALDEPRRGPQTQELIRDLKAADGILLFCDCEMMVAGDGEAADQIGRMMSIVGDLVDEVTEESLATLAGLVSTVAVSEYVLGSIIPVSCGVNTENVQVPVLFCLHIGIVVLVNSLIEKIEEHTAKKELFDSQVGLIDEIGSWWRDEPSFSDLAVREVQQALEAYEKVERLRPPAEALGGYLEELLTF
jgi:hypothetical protein